MILQKKIEQANLRQKNTLNEMVSSYINHEELKLKLINIYPESAQGSALDNLQIQSSHIDCSSGFSEHDRRSRSKRSVPYDFQKSQRLKVSLCHSCAGVNPGNIQIQENFHFFLKL